jgi:transposase
MNSTQVAVDLAKSVFQVAVSSTPGRVDEEHRLSRARFQQFFVGREPVEVLMEACGTAHHWGREVEALGHTVLLLPPADVRRYRDGNKTDRADAKALLEAARNEAIDAVPLKTIDQQTITALHRLRSGYLQTRTARINAVRGLLREFGITIPVGARHLVPRVRAAIENGALPTDLESVLRDALTEIEELRAKAQGIERRLKSLVRHMPEAEILLSVPGIGVLTATALVAFVGDVHRFRSGRHFAAYLGLTPREHSSGLSRRIGRISKRGNRYLRMLLIHGARSVLRAAKLTDNPDGLRTWALGVAARSGYNTAAVALANKLARIAWRRWRDGQPFESRLVA